MFGFFKKKKAHNVEKQLFKSHFTNIINNDRKRNGLAVESSTNLLIADFVMNEIVNVSSVWLKGRDFTKDASQKEIIILGLMTYYLFSVVNMSIRSDFREIPQFAEEGISDCFKTLLKDPNFVSKKFINEVKDFRDMVSQKYSYEKCIETFKNAYLQCLGDIEKSDGNFTGRKSLLLMTEQLEKIYN